MNNECRIISPMGTGNGAFVVHKLLEKKIPGYRVVQYNPYRTLFPPSLFPVGRSGHAGLIHAAPDYAYFFARNDVPLILTFHNYVLDRFMRGYSSVAQNIHYQTDLKAFTRMAVRKAHTLTAVSRFTAELVRSDMKLTDNIRVIYNGIDDEVFVPKKTPTSAKTTIKVLFSGNLSQRKGAQWLVPIAEKLGQNIKIIYTSGLQPKGFLSNQANLQCLGAVPYNQMPGVYQDADILLFPTVREGFGLAAAEAMSCGLPVVATDCSSLPELIDEGKGGFLCPVGDVNAFAEKIRFLAENSRLRREMGEYNRAKVEKMFTLNRMIAEYRNLFEEILSAGR
ncbi:MAG: glycosyltransferase family 1 protein [Deltaproteobacteria bacterium]|nr:glycosyltransferase family 1 protein [Deltaproteobacteria bacterium]